MTRQMDKSFLGFECTPALYEAVRADAFKRRKSVSETLRTIVQDHYLSSQTIALKGLQNEEGKIQ